MKLNGLTAKQVEESRQKHGANTLTQIPPDPLWKKILEGFKDPMILILCVALVIQVVLWLGLDTNLLKLLSALIVALFLALPYWKSKIHMKGGHKHA